MAPKKMLANKKRLTRSSVRNEEPTSSQVLTPTLTPTPQVPTPTPQVPTPTPQVPTPTPQVSTPTTQVPTPMTESDSDSDSDSDPRDDGN